MIMFLGLFAFLSASSQSARLSALGHVVCETYQFVFIRDPDGVFLELVGPPEPAVEFD